MTLKIAFTTSGRSLDSLLDPRFGRAPGFLIYETDDGSTEYISNTQNYNAVQGAGIQSAQNLGGAGVSAVVTGHCGPKAYSVLTRAGIKVYNTNLATVAEALEALRSGDMPAAGGPDRESHWR
jgi:predicted Fe-Mo cluster-binding NifX family protein